MKSVGWIILFLFGGYIVFRYYSVTVQIDKNTQSRQVAPPGINYYSCTPVTHRQQQLWAFESVNPCSTLNACYFPAFGPQENQPASIARLEI